MPFGIVEGGDVKKAFDEAVSSLEDLRVSIKRDSEEDAIPRSKFDRAINSMVLLRKTLEGTSVGEELHGRKRKVLELISTMNDPAILTALGTLGVEFSGALKSVQQVLHSADPKKTKKVDQDPLRKH